MDTQDVINQYELWKSTPVDTGRVISYFEETNKMIVRNWFGKPEDTPYRRTHDRYNEYISILRGDISPSANLVDYVNRMVTDLYSHWKTSPDNVSIPLVLENYIYLQKHMKSTGY